MIQRLRGDRRVLIGRLVDHTLENLRADPQGVWLRALLARGFPGFENMSDQRLLAELQLRGLAEVEAEDELPDDEEGDHDPQAWDAQPGLKSHIDLPESFER